MYTVKDLDEEYHKGRDHARQEAKEILQRHIRKAERNRVKPWVLYMLDQILTEIVRDI